MVALQCCKAQPLHNKMNQPYTYRYPLLFGLPSHLGYHSALGRVPCAIQYVPIGCCNALLCGLCVPRSGLDLDVTFILHASGSPQAVEHSVTVA